MPHLVLERDFDPPLTVADVRSGVASSDRCYALHRVRWLGSYLSAGGRTMICTFSAPDAESARIALRQSGADTHRLWSASVYEGPSAVTPNVMVERSLPAPDTFERLHGFALAKSWCFEQRRVRWAGSLLSSDGRRMLCFYQAPDAESVRAAQREAEMPTQAVWAYERISPDDV
jgi:uncharacterized protein DUF4242